MQALKALVDAPVEALFHHDSLTSCVILLGTKSDAKARSQHIDAAASKEIQRRHTANLPSQ